MRIEGCVSYVDKQLHKCDYTKEREKKYILLVSENGISIYEQGESTHNHFRVYE
jgi:hypothetical protein